jgi:peptidoglycan/LPS O-acetylase OafA/YrhL
MNNRIEQLDSVRGLAALVVLISHLPLIGMPLLATNMLKALGIINGHAAVVIFFVLSGFVLSIPFFKQNKIEYTPYLIKRIFRIYMPYAIAVIFALFLSQMFYSVKIDGLGQWVNKLWKTEVTTKLIMEHIYLIGNTHTESFNGAIWSLIHELRISLIFPFVVILVKRFSLKYNMLLCLLLCCIAGMNNIFHIQISNGYLVTYFDTITFLSVFICGALIAKHHSIIMHYYSALSIRVRFIILGLSIIMYNYVPYIIFYATNFLNNEIFSAYSLIIMEHITTLGAIGFIISAMGSVRIATILMQKPIAFLGKISYSLYLFHMPVLLSCVFLLNGRFSYYLISAIATVLSIIVATCAWYTIENPFNRVGRSLSAKLRVATSEGILKTVRQRILKKPRQRGLE